MVNSTGSSSDPDFAPSGIDRGVAGLDDLGRRAAVDTAEDGLDASDELGRRERLGEVVVATQLEAEHPVDLPVARGEEDHGDLRRLAQSLAHFEPVDVGQTDVEDDETRAVRTHGLEAGLPGGSLQYAVALTGEVQVDEVRDIGFVVDDEDRSPFHGPIVARRARPRCEPDVSEP